MRVIRRAQWIRESVPVNDNPSESDLTKIGFERWITIIFLITNCTAIV